MVPQQFHATDWTPEKIDHFLNRSPLPLAYINSSGTIVFTNQVCTPLLNQWGVQVGVGLPAAQLNLFRLAQHSQKPVETELAIGNRTYHILFASIPDSDAVGLYASDITELIHINESILTSEHQYRSLFEHMLEGFAYCRMLFEDGQPVDFQYLAVNRAFETLTGLQGVVGRWVSEVIPGLRESNPELYEIYGRVAMTGVPAQFETYLDTLGIWFAISVYSPAQDHFVAVFENITSRKQAEQDLKRSAQELSLLDQVRTALAREVAMSVILRRVVEAVAETFDYQLVSIYTLEDDTLILAHNIGYPRVLHRIPLGKGIMSRAVVSGQLVFLEDVHADPEFLETLDGIESEIAVPLYLKGKVVGVLNVESTNGVRLSERDLNLLKNLGETISIAFERAYLYDELRRSGERFQVSVETLLDGFAIFTAVRDATGPIVDFRCEYINQAGCLLSQQTREELLGGRILDLLPLSQESGNIAQYAAVVETEEPLMTEILQYDEVPGGKRLTRAYEVRAVRLGDGVAMTWRDITMRRRNETLLEQRNQELALLNHAGQVFNSTLEIDAVLQRVLEMLTPQWGVASSFWLVDDTGGLICRQAYGPGSEAVQGWRLHSGEGLVGWVAQHGESVVIADAQNDPRHYPGVDRKTGLLPRSILMTPLKVKDQVIGVLQLLDTQPDAYDPGAVALVEALAAIAAVAVENAHLYAQVEQSAIHDELTGLCNRRGFLLLAEQQMRQAERSGGCLLLVFIDIDDFKHTNDTLGHAAGDAALASVAQILRQTFRSSDIIARMGGDEFVVLTPVPHADDANFPLRRLVAGLQDGDIHVDQIGPLSLSVGQALWRADTPCSLDQLLSRADASMYEQKVAKRKGR
jgi:diguanylate cyclase (GGDEF)-like protein